MYYLQYYFCSETAKSSQQSCGRTYENSKYRNKKDEHDNNYAGEYNRGGAPQRQQQTTQVYRPPHRQHRMNMQKYV